MHSQAKHIEVKHHFLRDHVQKGDIELKIVETKLQLVDFLTKPLIEDMFKFMKSLINMKNPNKC